MKVPKYLPLLFSAGLIPLGVAASGPIFEQTGDFIVIEAESADELGNWVLHSDSSVYGWLEGFSGNGCIQFTGNTDVSGPPDSPLTYRFMVNRAGDYKLMARALEAPLETGEGDKANDCYLRLVGVPNYQGEFTKFVMLGDSYKWSWNVMLESAHHYFESPLYPLKQGVYQLQVAGRSKNFFLDRLVLYRIDDGEPYRDLALESTVFSEPTALQGEYLLSAMKDFAPIHQEGMGMVYFDKQRNAIAVNAAQEELRTVFSAASTPFKGKSGTYDLQLKTLTEIDGESTYRVFINDQRIGNYTNPGTVIDYSPSWHTWEQVVINQGDVIRVESKPATNGKIPEGNGTAWSRGRWVSVLLVPSM